MAANPIELIELINVNDVSGTGIPKAIEIIDELQFFLQKLFSGDTIEKTNKYKQEVEMLTAKLENLAYETQKTNQAGEIGQKTLEQNALALQAMTKAVDAARLSKTELLALDEKSEMVVNDLSDKLRLLVGYYQKVAAEGNVLKVDTEQLNNQFKGIVSEISSVLGALQEFRAEQIYAADSVKALEILLKQLKTEWKMMSEEMKYSSEAGTELAARIQNLNLQLNEEKAILSGVGTEYSVLIKMQQELTAVTSKLELITDELTKNLMESKVELELKTKAIKLDTLSTQDNTDRAAENKVAQDALTKSIQHKADVILAERSKINVSTQEEILINKQANAELLLRNKIESEAIGTIARTKAENKLYQLQREQLISTDKNYASELIRLNALIKENTILINENAEGAKVARTNWGRFGDIFERMGLRMMASMIWMTIIIGSLTAIYEWITKVSDATQLATDRLKDYFDSFSQTERLKLDSIPKTQASIEVEINNTNRLVKEMQDHNLTLDQRFNKYKELMGLYPKIFDAMDKEGFKNKEGGDRMKEMISNRASYIAILKEQSAQQELVSQLTETKYKNIDQKEILEKDLVKGVRKNYSDENDNVPIGGKILKTDKEIIDFFVKNANADKERSYFLNDVWDKASQIKQINEDQVKILEDIKSTNRALDSLGTQKTFLEGNEKDKKPKTPHKKPKFTGEEDEHLFYMEELKETYNESKKSLDDKLELYRLEDLEVNRHYVVQKKMIEDYNKISGENIFQQNARLMQNTRNHKREQNNIEESRQKDIEDMKKYEDERLRVLEESNRKLLRNAEENRRELEQINVQRRKNSIQAGANARFSPIGAALGTGGGNAYADYKDKLALKDIDIGQDNANVFEDSNIALSANSRIREAKSKLDDISAIPNNEKTPYQLDLQKKREKEYQDSLDFKSKADTKFTQDYLKLQDDRSQKDTLIADKSKSDKVKLAQATFDAVETIANKQMDLQKKRIQAEMQSVQNLAQFEMTLAGNNSAAKIRIAQAEHGKIKALKQKEAQVEKEQGLFSVAISTAKGIASALSLGPTGIPLAVVIGTLGLAQAVAIESQPLPQYFKGKSKGGGKDGLARINEKGFELVEREGVYKVFGDGHETIADIKQSDRILTHEESNNFLSMVMKGGGIIKERDNLNKKEQVIIIQNQLKKEDMQEAMEKAILKMPKNELTLPADHVTKTYRGQQERAKLW